ncbi:MAG TPA: TetR/AcrR family transcriptional regulator [Acidobacteriaceae bacterium]|jgi:TetR/AcrR family fatty acid metabolism transcriptional regulator|nr:TetR/AcrR family transcriptional regulator [Acidobacteriaceae bacterium]
MSSPEPIDKSDQVPSQLDQPRSGDKHQRILDAAVQVIAEHGFFNARVSEIASRAGVADGTVYLYFKNKDHILREAIDTAFRNFFDRAKQEIQTVSSARMQLELLARLHLETLAAHRNLAIVMQTEVRQSARFIAEFSHQHLVDYLNLVREVIRLGQEQGLFREDISDRLVAHCMFGALDEMVSSWVFTGRPFDPDKIASAVMNLIFSGIETSRENA